MEDTGIIESIEENMKNITTAASEGRLQQLLEEMMPGIVGFLLNIVFAFILLFVGRTDRLIKQRQMQVSEDF